MNYKKFTPREKKNSGNGSGRPSVSFAQTHNNHNNRRSCHGDRCWGNCNNPECTAPGAQNRNNQNNDNEENEHNNNEDSNSAQQQ